MISHLHFGTRRFTFPRIYRNSKTHEPVNIYCRRKGSRYAAQYVLHLTTILASLVQVGSLMLFCDLSLSCRQQSCPVLTSLALRCSDRVIDQFDSCQGFNGTICLYDFLYNDIVGNIVIVRTRTEL